MSGRRGRLSLLTACLLAAGSFPARASDYEPVQESLENLDARYRPMVSGVANVRGGDAPFLGTAFHIGNGLVLMAGHSISFARKPGQTGSLSEVCRSNVTFGWGEVGSMRGEVSKCVELVGHHFTPNGLDYAVVRTDFVPTYRFALELEDIGRDEPIGTAREVVDEDYSRMLPRLDVQVLGHPEGLPLNRSLGCRTRFRNGAYYESSRWHFVNECSLRGGFSGSPVISASSGKVLGIHITSSGWATKLSSIPGLREVLALEQARPGSGWPNVVRR